MNRNLSENRNLLSPNKFRLVIDGTRFSNTEFFCVEAPLPGMTLPEVPVGMGPNTAYFSGDKMDYPALTFRVMVDEDLANYKEICKWMWDNQFKGYIFHDMILQIYSSSLNVAREIKFISCFPSSIGSVTFNVQNQGVDYLATDITFRFDRFEIL